MTRQHFRQMGPRGVQWIGPILVALLVAAAGWWTLTAVADLQDAAIEGQIARELLAQDVDALRDQVLELGEIPIAPPPEDRVDQDLPEPILIPGPSCVEEYGFALCRGPEGREGKPGADSTVPGPSCVEEFGIEECRGDPGEASTVPGPSCVEEFGLEECRGDVGADSAVPGPAGDSCVEELGLEACRGDPGPEGRGIVAIAIEGDRETCELVITYTDETSERLPIDRRFCPGQEQNE